MTDRRFGETCTCSSSCFHSVFFERRSGRTSVESIDEMGLSSTPHVSTRLRLERRRRRCHHNIEPRRALFPDPRVPDSVAGDMGDDVTATGNIVEGSSVGAAAGAPPGVPGGGGGGFRIPKVASSGAGGGSAADPAAGAPAPPPHPPSDPSQINKPYQFASTSRHQFFLFFFFFYPVCRQFGASGSRAWRYS